MKAEFLRLSAIAALAMAAFATQPADSAARATAHHAAEAPKVRDWTRVVSPTPDGGFVMGNPAAKVKLVEFGSMTCPHCRAFDAEGVPTLINDYVKSGKVSWEFRNYVRDAFDVSAALIARCNGAKGFFPLTRAIFKDQPSWEAQIQKTPQDQLKSMENLPTDRVFAEAAKVAGLQAVAATHGLPAARSSQCLANKQSIDQLVHMAADATTRFPDFPGTPTFVINGKMLDRTATWGALEPQLKNALGERG